MVYEVYKISNDVNDKLYIGITSCGVVNRFNQHIKADSYIGNAIRKHGANHFKIDVIDVADTKQEVMDKEVYWIDYFNSFNNGYNLTVGGEGASLNTRIQVRLNERQKKFISYVEKENKKSIDVNDHKAMVNMILMNLLHCYLLSDNKRDKKESARLLVKLKRNLFDSLLKTKLIEYEEVNSWLI